MAKISSNRSSVTSTSDSLDMITNASSTNPNSSSMAHPLNSKRNIFDDDSSSSDEDGEDGGANLAAAASAFKINEEYARRFEHNKKREELHRRASS